MLKRLIKLSVVLSIVLTSTAAIAQNTGKPEYPRYSFSSNWSLGGALHLNNQAYLGGFSFGDNWRRSTNFGADIFLQQKINHVFDWRLRGAGDIPTGLDRATHDSSAYFRMDRHATLTVEMLISINNAILGYDPDRRFNLYVYGGAGVVLNYLFSTSEGNNPRVSEEKFGRLCTAITAGLGMSYGLDESNYLFCEYGYDINGDISSPSTFFSKDLHDANRLIRLGYYHCFGLSEQDQAIASQKSMLTQENFGALNTQVNDLENQINNAKNNEKKLQSRINELEDQLAACMKNGGGKAAGNNAASDSLQAIINQIKADQLNFYAMPFSVQYGVDKWQVSEEEADKVKAVARVLKDNSNVKIKVVGFADYTGSDEYNMKLSEKRANEVKRILVKQYGIDESRITVDYKGKSVAFGDIQFPLNRRVSFYRAID